MRLFARITAIIVINVILIVLLLEILLRVFAPSLGGTVGVAARWATTGDRFDGEWSQAWQQNIDHYWALRPGLEDSLQYGSPTVSFSMSTVELWEGGGIGFRTDPVDFQVDAVVVGDSFGMCFTERADCWVEIFAARTRLGTVNLSQPVTGSTSHYRILRDFGEPLQPPLVIWQFFGNDFNDDYGLAVFRDEIDALPAPENDTSPELTGITGWLRQHSALVTVTETLVTGSFAGVPAPDIKPYRVTYGDQDEHLLQFGGAYELSALDMDREANQIGLNYSRDAFSNASELVNQWNGELVVLMIPTREEVYRHLTVTQMGRTDLERLESAREAMRDLCDELDLICYDAYDALVDRARDDEALYYSDDMHLNPHGNQVVAEALAVWLAQDGLLPEVAIRRETGD